MSETSEFYARVQGMVDKYNADVEMWDDVNNETLASDDPDVIRAGIAVLDLAAVQAQRQWDDIQALKSQVAQLAADLQAEADAMSELESDIEYLTDMADAYATDAQGYRDWLAENADPYYSQRLRSIQQRARRVG